MRELVDIMAAFSEWCRRNEVEPERVKIVVDKGRNSFYFYHGAKQEAKSLLLTANCSLPSNFIIYGINIELQP